MTKAKATVLGFSCLFLSHTQTTSQQLDPVTQTEKVTLMFNFSLAIMGLKKKKKHHFDSMTPGGEPDNNPSSVVVSKQNLALSQSSLCD